MIKIKRVSSINEKSHIDIIKTCENSYALQRYESYYDDEEEVEYDSRVYPNPDGIYADIDAVNNEANRLIQIIDEQEIQEAEQLLKDKKQSCFTHEMLMEEQAIQDGWCLEQYRHQVSLRKKLQVHANLLIDKPVEEWPEFEINWDLTPENFRFAFDGDVHSPNKFNEYYPDGLALGWVNQAEFYSKLCHFNKRALNEIWTVGFAHSLAYVVAYCAAGEPLTPVVARPDIHHEGQVFLSGGNHRYAMINSIGVERMPLLIEHKHRDEMIKLLPSLSFYEITTK